MEIQISNSSSGVQTGFKRKLQYEEDKNFWSERRQKFSKDSNSDLQQGSMDNWFPQSNSRVNQNQSCESTSSFYSYNSVSQAQSAQQTFSKQDQQQQQPIQDGQGLLISSQSNYSQRLSNAFLSNSFNYVQQTQQAQLEQVNTSQNTQREEFPVSPLIANAQSLRKTVSESALYKKDQSCSDDVSMG